MSTSFVSHADIDECALDVDDCSEKAICTNAPGSFSCMCNEGYDGNGTTCVGKHIPINYKSQLETIVYLCITSHYVHI